MGVQETLWDVRCDVMAGEVDGWMEAETETKPRILPWNRETSEKVNVKEELLLGSSGICLCACVIEILDQMGWLLLPMQQ